MNEPTPKERPIAFTADNVLLIERDLKIETRRVVTPQPVDKTCYAVHREEGIRFSTGEPAGGIKYPCVPGDRLWIQEAHRLRLAPDYGGQTVEVVRVADLSRRVVTLADREWELMQARKNPVTTTFGAIIPPRFMYRTLSRRVLEVESVRAEWLHEIDDAGAWKEGMRGADWKTPREQYQDLWESIHGEGSWAANPIVWVVRFRKVTP